MASKSAVTKERNAAIKRATERVVAENVTMYIHQSDKWADTFFVSPVDTHPNAKLIKQVDP